MAVITPETVILLTVIVQALAISVVSPVRWGQQQVRLFQRYPPSQYPKFYVYSIKIEFTLLAIRILLDFIALFIIGYLVFIANILNNQTNVFAAWVFCTAIQLIPSLYSLIALQLSAIKRKKTVTVKTKKFSLIARSIFDHISLVHLTLLVLSILLTLNIIFSNAHLDAPKQFGLSALFIVTNLLLTHRIYISIYGKNHDKLINDEDRANKRHLDVQRSIVGISATVGIFALLGMMGENNNAQSTWLIVPFSLFIQLAILNRSQRWHAEDMDVYKSTN